MDAGIIKNFKLHYRVELVNNFLNTFEVERKISLPNIKETIFRYGKKAWSLVNSETISNCFQPTKIIGQNTATINFSLEESTKKSLRDRITNWKERLKQFVYKD